MDHAPQSDVIFDMPLVIMDVERSFFEAGYLGTALETLGERESGTAKLEEAVVAYRAARLIADSAWPFCGAPA